MCRKREYNYLLYRVEYPLKRGYRMEPKRLPDWIKVVIVEEHGSKQLHVCSRIHINKDVEVGPSYCNLFKDEEILREQSAEVHRRFL